MTDPGFSKGGSIPTGVYANVLFGKPFAGNYMKIKTDEVGLTSLAPPPFYQPIMKHNNPDFYE